MLLIMIALYFGTTSALNLTCHCLDGVACFSNGFCPNTCEQNWVGPGCQIGNRALGKIARQSTTYTDDFGNKRSADRAVDGNLSIEYSSTFCTKTISNTEFGNLSSAKNDSAWWVVTLSATQSYIVRYVFLHNQRGPNSSRLTNFVILYSNDTEGDPDPTNDTWHVCATEHGTVGNNRVYYCNNNTIAKRVAVFLMSSPSNMEVVLTLCEVQVYGYEYFDCPSGYTGPGCLLRSCDTCSSTNGKCSSDFGGCRYDVCPDQWLFPPYCWITLSNPAELIISSTVTCNSIRLFAILPDRQPNIAASSVRLQLLNTADRQIVLDSAIPLLGNNSVYYNFANAAADTSYNVSLKLVHCYGICFNSTGSKVINLRTGKRQYLFSRNSSCVFVKVNSTTPECEPPSSMQISCEPAAGGSIIIRSSSSNVCGLKSEQAYNCSVAATVDGNTIERYSEILLPESLAESLLAGKDNAVLAGSIGGSFAAAIFLTLAIILIVYCSGKRNSSSHALARDPATASARM